MLFCYAYIHNLLQANLAVQENRLTAATNELNTAQAQLDEKQRELDKVQAVYDAAMTEKQVWRQFFLCCKRSRIYLQRLKCTSFSQVTPNKSGNSTPQ